MYKIIEYILCYWQPFALGLLFGFILGINAFNKVDRELRGLYE